MTHHKSASSGKDVLYIDVDDEITAVIDKVLASKHKIVALVLPKRASAFQSVVNMKLLKRSADQAKKSLVLITSEASLLPLAGGVGLHVSKSLQSKPEVPDAPEKTDDKSEAIEEEAFAAGAAAVGASTTEPKLDRTKSLAELSGDDDEEETIELDDEIDEDPLKDSDSKDDKKAGKSKLKKFKIPNFNRFRLILFGGGAALILLIFFGVMAFKVMPKAQITISTDSSAINVSQDIKLKTGADVVLDPAQAIVPATKQEVKKTLTQEVPATGEKNNGEKASGSIDMTGSDCSGPSYSPPNDVAAGVGVTANGKTFVTQKKASFSPTSYDPGSGCFLYKANNIGIVAQTGGANGNVTGATFTVAGRSDVTAVGSASGGTDVIVKVVAQADIDSAKQKITTTDSEAVKLELTAALQEADLFAIENSFNTAAPTTKLSANVGDAADVVTVTQDLVYSMFGVKREDLEKIVSEQVKTKIDPTKQSILDYGFDEATFTLLTSQPDVTTVGFQTTAVTGSDLDEDEIKKQVAGKKANDAKELIGEYPGVTDVKVTYSPFWVSSIPKKTGKITVIIEKPKITDAESQSNE